MMMMGSYRKQQALMTIAVVFLMACASYGAGFFLTTPFTVTSPNQGHDVCMMASCRPNSGLSRVGSVLDIPRALSTSMPLSPSEIFRMFDDLDFTPSIASPSRRYGALMQMDVKETKDAYQLYLDMPGFDIKDINLQLKGQELTISAERESTKKEEGDNILRLERASGAVTRTLSLPEDTDLDGIKAEAKNGVLTITVPKRPETVVLERKIEIKEQQ